LGSYCRKDKRKHAWKSISLAFFQTREHIEGTEVERGLLLAIEPARSVAERPVQTLRMVRRADEEETVVALEAVEFV
jgi:hypothetical protein